MRSGSGNGYERVEGRGKRWLGRKERERERGNVVLEGKSEGKTWCSRIKE